MNVETFTMDQAEAQAKFREYACYLNSTAEKEYAALAAAYKAAAAGKAVINLRDAITNAPTFPNGLPRVAVARADQKQVRAQRTTGGRLRMWCGSDWWHARRARTLQFEYEGLRPLERDANGMALVPMIPVEARRKAGMRRRLDGLFILWEVEEWKLVPPVDPFLLKHIGGDLYAVLAAWDLTPIERAVMAGRARA